MRQLTTIFEISAGTPSMSEGILILLASGAVAFLAGITGLFFPERTEGLFEKKLDGPVFLIVWGSILLLVIFLGWKMAKFDRKLLLNDYRSGQYQVAEGFVHVTHEQPFNGHTAGDKIIVGGIEFEVNPPTGSLGYRRTISHGGVLREGVFARLLYHSGNYLGVVILKVEIGGDEK